MTSSKSTRGGAEMGRNTSRTSLTMTSLLLQLNDGTQGFIKLFTSLFIYIFSVI